MDTVFKICMVIMMLPYAYTAPRQPRLSLAEYVPSQYYNHIDNGDGQQMYSFGYDVSDPVTGNTQYRSEERHANGTVTGSYGYVDPFGTPQRFKYIADTFGYRVYTDALTQKPFPSAAFAGDQQTEPSITWTRPPRPYKHKLITDLVSHLGTLFTKNNFI